MSTDPRGDVTDVELDDEPEDEGPEHTDGSIELDQRDVFRVLFNDPAVRNYMFAGLSSLAMIFLILFQQGSDLGGLLVVVVGVAGLLLRWLPTPLFVLLLLTYFMVFPFGIPGEAFENRWEIEEGRFRLTDILMALAVLVYVVSHYRIIGIVQQVVAYEGAVRRNDEPATRRPAALVAPSELGVVLLLAAGLVILGQLVWWIVNSVEITPTNTFPFSWVGEGRSLRRTEPSAGLPPGTTRFMALVGLGAFSVLIGRLVFGYWRLRTMGAAEGGMILLDDGWSETKRERSRLETWRIWGRRRANAQAEAAAKEQKEQAKKGERPGFRTRG